MVGGVCLGLELSSETFGLSCSDRLAKLVRGRGSPGVYKPSGAVVDRTPSSEREGQESDGALQPAAASRHPEPEAAADPAADLRHRDEIVERLIGRADGELEDLGGLDEVLGRLRRLGSDLVERAGERSSSGRGLRVEKAGLLVMPARLCSPGAEKLGPNVRVMASRGASGELDDADLRPPSRLDIGLENVKRVRVARPALRVARVAEDREPIAGSGDDRPRFLELLKVLSYRPERGRILVPIGEPGVLEAVGALPSDSAGDVPIPTRSSSRRAFEL